MWLLLGLSGSEAANMYIKRDTCLSQFFKSFFSSIDTQLMICLTCYLWQLSQFTEMLESKDELTFLFFLDVPETIYSVSMKQRMFYYYYFLFFQTFSLVTHANLS